MQEAAAPLSDQLFEQRQRTRHLSFAVNLKTKAQGNGKRRTDQGDGNEAVIVLDLSSHLTVHLVLHLAFHTGIATAGEGTADFDSVYRRNDQAPGPVRVEHAISLQLAGDRATKFKYRLRGLSFQRVTEGIVTDRPDALGQRSTATRRLDLKQAGHLHGRAQENGVKDFLPRVPGKLATLGQGAPQFREAKHLIEISLEAVPGQVSGFPVPGETA